MERLSYTLKRNCWPQSADLRDVRDRTSELRLLRSVTLATVGLLRTFCGLIADRRKPGLLDLPALMLPALLFLSAVFYTAWSSWWI